ncbi:hypothetical protein GLOIN_2v1483723 [Rhizophagus irregularis DAOM 181602=DAOM 197198]|uniref:Uncharacterized protein n=2 Tax=Rhizophagus irregularis TaxID=588596 RepID=A0A2H5SNW0_RHIID|nr:hypothetical protein GLOIN_2v1483723 [Rhizophagus irregularis DAOM 181602=DAOM 197198]POG64672.1 hypothetical protein GLOIN_2v1483723 [Rhizophagus irregularis DAOM 181602=DAOM 197198]GBC32017.1 hypothetical protein GLOIN_2v1483723 [Rhizophagus irregularis DAOM 181602=DAOM 197198]CAG8487414.1 7343_t:CDS:1 [Rhizophagus irregularis]|eukprot:XP_025171538.1 hypothetical protein GLOIN_2v1483723 [Rhizophagus irregularis DAOM 181602=DAOM 197198]
MASSQVFRERDVKCCQLHHVVDCICYNSSGSNQPELSGSDAIRTDTRLFYGASTMKNDTIIPTQRVLDREVRPIVPFPFLVTIAGVLGNTKIMQKNVDIMLENAKKNMKIMEDAIAVMKGTGSQFRNINARLKQIESTRTKRNVLRKYGPWVMRFNNEIVRKIGREKWRLAKYAMDYLEKGVTLTQDESSSILQLTELLHSIGMTVEDYKLLLETRELRGHYLHDHTFPMEKAKADLTSLVDDLAVYKIPLSKALQAL